MTFSRRGSVDPFAPVVKPPVRGADNPAAATTVLRYVPATDVQIVSTVSPVCAQTSVREGPQCVVH